MLKTSAYGLGFQHLPRDLATLMHGKPCLIPILKYNVQAWSLFCVPAFVYVTWRDVESGNEIVVVIYQKHAPTPILNSYRTQEEDSIYAYQTTSI